MNNIIGKMVHNTATELHSESEYKTTAETVVRGAKASAAAFSNQVPTLFSTYVANSSNERTI